MQLLMLTDALFRLGLQAREELRLLRIKALVWRPDSLDALLEHRLKFRAWFLRLARDGMAQPLTTIMAA